MEKVESELKEYIVEGMTCSGCATTIEGYLKNNGYEEVTVNFATRELRFKPQENDDPVIGIEKLGYRVWPVNQQNIQNETSKSWTNLQKRLAFSVIFTLPLLLHMFVSWHFLHNAWVQLSLSVLVLVIGLIQFAPGAWGSIRAKSPNMDVLILSGALAAFVYSLYGMIWHTADGTMHHYLFFETSAAIITLVLLGNFIEERAVKLTAKSLHTLESLQPKTARKYTWNLATGEETLLEVPSDSLQVNDFVQANEGDRLPADGIVFSGRAELDNSHLTGESVAVVVNEADKVAAGATVISGSINVQISAVGRKSSLGEIIRMVKDAQAKKPPIQRFGDKVSAVFVPAVLIIAIFAFAVNFWLLHIDFTPAVIRSIAILVIACPCAMGLATPTALMVGLGRAARQGIIVKDGGITERLSEVKTIVFDKTGTLTTGRFRFSDWWFSPVEKSEYWQAVILAMSKKSGHPIAQSVLRELEGKITLRPALKDIREEKGVGMRAEDTGGSRYFWGRPERGIKYDLVLKRDEKVVAGVLLTDDIRTEAHEALQSLKNMGFDLVLLSGDSDRKCRDVAGKLEITRYYSECLPGQKLEILNRLKAEGPVAMVGDGINDAPALSAADVGISLGNATDIAQQSAGIIISGGNLLKIPEAIAISRKTFKTIRQNLIWALLYNVVAIPIAGLGFLSPIIGALSMAFSDLVVIGNSLRLRLTGFNQK